MKSQRNHINSDNGEHQLLSTYLKDVHLSLRKAASKEGGKKAWQEHCLNKDTLTKYAEFMEKLATKHWSDNNEEPSRISWTANFCDDYFNNQHHLNYYKKEQAIAIKVGVHLAKEVIDRKIKLLDVGSCYNPFKEYEFLDVTGVDLCPANNTVFQCDILDVSLGATTIVKDNKVLQLQKESFDAVVFSFLLEYIPTSELRISACTKAYSLLKPGGLLLIATPDSNHVGANAKLMKCWRYTLALLGFSRIQYKKYKFIHCMAFRKSLHKDVASRWAMLYKETYMEYSIHIPQDFKNNDEEEDQLHTEPHESFSNFADFKEMPFSDNVILL